MPNGLSRPLTIVVSLVAGSSARAATTEVVAPRPLSARVEGSSALALQSVSSQITGHIVDLFVTGLRFDNRNPDGVVLDSERTSATDWRADAKYVPRDGWLLELGSDVECMADRRDMRRRLSSTPAPTLLNDYDTGAHASSAYLQVTRTIGSWLTLSPGASVNVRPRATGGRSWPPQMGR